MNRKEKQGAVIVEYVLLFDVFVYIYEEFSKSS